jgi:two-component system cell cycle response regulator
MRVLIAEDDPIGRRALEARLTKLGYEVTVASNGGEAWKLLAGDDPPKLVVLDWMMPVLDGVEVCRRLKARPDGEFFYVVMLTAKDRKSDIVTGIDAGADDYVTKPFDAGELRARLRAGQRIVELEEQLVAAREALRQEAMHDPLTGLWNHSAVSDILGRELDRASRERRPLSVVMADIDRFKRVNDTFGHEAGDTVLVEISRRLCAGVRSYDAVGRYGGDEFVIVLAGCGRGCAAARGEQLRRSVAERGFNLGGRSVPVTISLGITVRTGSVRTTNDHFIRAADDALYAAKRAGRNRVEVTLVPRATITC